MKTVAKWLIVAGLGVACVLGFVLADLVPGEQFVTTAIAGTCGAAAIIGALAIRKGMW